MDKFKEHIMREAIFNNTVTDDQLPVFCTFYLNKLIANGYDLCLTDIHLLKLLNKDYPEVSSMQQYKRLASLAKELQGRNYG